MNFDKALDAVLKSRKYDILTGRAIDLIAYLKDLFINLFIKILQKLGFKIVSSNFQNVKNFANLFFVLIIISVLVLAFFIIKHYLKIKKHTKSMEEIFEDLKNKKITLNDILALSRDYEKNRNFRESVRYMYIGVLWQLGQKEIIDINPNKTNKQLLSELKEKRPKYFDYVSQTVSIFQNVYFGHKEIKASPLNIFLKDCENFISEVSSDEK